MQFITKVEMNINKTLLNNYQQINLEGNMTKWQKTKQKIAKKEFDSILRNIITRMQIENIERLSLPKELVEYLLEIDINVGATISAYGKTINII